MSRRIVALVAAASLWTCPAAAVELSVAVAAHFAPTLAALSPQFQAQTGHAVRAASGSTGKLLAQITQGAPFDVLLAADAESARRIAAQGLAEADSQVAYAVGRLVLYSARPGLVDGQGAVLDSDRFGKLALANPKLAPYGAAAEAVLQRLGLLERSRARWVVGENIAQTFQFVYSGAADLGFVARAQVVARPGGSTWLVPTHLHPPLVHDGIVLSAARRKSAAQAAAARQLLGWLRTPHAQAVLVAAGYDAVAQTKAAP
ncbi:MAG: molybdate ABC transporter substrate-binding protein [Deltaproteobacteria bacterium]|nr:molybdate ABC transporter substrate-binding protein [Deltaproteobacteria bacterium]